jgi:hypothetical protein
MINAINTTAATQIPPRRLRRKNVESSPPVAVPGSVPPGAAAGGRCAVDGWTEGWPCQPPLGIRDRALDLGVRRGWLQDTRDHGLAAVRPSFDGAMRSFIRLCN